MSIDSGTCYLSFPLREDLPDAEVFVVRDLDVVGVGALRRHQLVQLQKTKRFVLQTFALQIPDSVHGIYEAELLNTLQWLRPWKVDLGEKLDLPAEHKETFLKVFPKTAQSLGLMSSRIRDLYLAEMEWSSWLLQDHWRYFVGFLRQKFSDNKSLLELAHWEWVQAWIEIQPFETPTPEKGDIQENPSLQIVSLTTANPVLNRDKGLYAFVYDEKKATVTERSLDVYEAQIIDLLHEDRKYTKKQLIEMALLSDEIDTQLSSNEWEKRFFSLVSDGILLYVE